jgi:uncharacterized protein YjbI with pentapeptide repeats
MYKQLTKIIILFTISYLLFGCGETVLMLNKPKPLSGQWLNVFKLKPAELTAYVAEHPMKLDNVLISKESISKSTIIGAEFKNTYWDDSFAQNATISNSIFSGGIMHDTSFADSTLTNVIFENMKMEKAEFINARLINVTFKNCKIFDSEIRNLRTSTINIENSELTNVSFFESELNITIKNTKIHEQGDFLGLKAGSKVLIEDSLIGPYSEFDFSKLQSFTVKNSVIKNSKMNDATVDEILIENTKMDFAMAGGTFNNIRMRNNKNFISIGRSKFTSLLIDECNDDFGISLRKTIFKTVSIRNCPSEIINASNAKGEKFQISNSNIGEAKFNGLIVKELILNDVNITKIANFEYTMAEDSLLTNFKIKSGSKVNMTGTNIKFE